MTMMLKYKRMIEPDASMQQRQQNNISQKTMIKDRYTTCSVYENAEVLSYNQLLLLLLLYILYVAYLYSQNRKPS
jgi:hypothetical protein